MAKEFIVYSATKEAFQAAVTAGTVDRSQIGIIADTAEVWINGQYLPLVELSDYLSKAALSVEPIEQKFTWRVATDDRKLTDSLAVVNKIIGNKVNWRQLIDRHNTNNSNDPTVVDPEGQVSVSYSGGTFTIKNSSPRLSQYYSKITTFGYVSSVYLQYGHKYLICADRAHYGIGIVEDINNPEFQQVNSVFTASSNAKPKFAISTGYDFWEEHSYSGDKKTVIQPEISMKLNLFDLTEMFGEYKEPENLGEFRRLYPRPYYDACVTPKVRGIVIDSFASPTYNLWNRGEAVEGAIMYDTGWLRSDAWYKKWRTYIMPVSPNTRYYLKNVANRSQCMPCVYFDKKMKRVGYDGPQDLNTGADSTSGEIVTPDNVSYMAVMVHKDFIGDACVSVSSRRNGDYEEYIESGPRLDAISELKDAEGNQVFPFGLLEGGGVFDEVGEGYALRRVDYKIDDNGNPWDFKQVQITNSAGNTVNGFNYYKLNNPLLMTWRLRRGGTERIRLGKESAPFRATISYALDANDLLAKPVEQNPSGGNLLAMSANGKTYDTGKAISALWNTIPSGSEEFIPTSDQVRVAIENLQPTTAAPATPKASISSSTAIILRANVVIEYQVQMSIRRYTIQTIAPSANTSNTYDDVWTLRGPVNTGTEVLFPSNYTVRWRNGQSPTFTAAGVFEMRIRKWASDSGDIYLAEWDVYYV